MAEPKLISADSHVNEPGDLWVERIDKQFRERAPRVVENLPGQRPGAYLVLEGVTPTHLAQGLGPGRAREGHGSRRRRGGRDLHDPGVPPVLAHGCGAAARLFPCLQRLAGRVLRLRAEAACRAWADLTV